MIVACNKSAKKLKTPGRCMLEEELNLYIESIKEYFESITDKPCDIGIPYAKDSTENTEVLDYTGLIGISGDLKGAVYFSATDALLRALTKAILQEENVEDDDLFAMVGEVANTIAGNTQARYSGRIEISVPIVLKGNLAGFRLQVIPPTYTIPFEWAGEKGCLVVGTDGSKKQ